jgi:hypothetical protein
MGGGLQGQVLLSNVSTSAGQSKAVHINARVRLLITNFVNFFLIFQLDFIGQVVHHRKDLAVQQPVD